MSFVGGARKRARTGEEVIFVRTARSVQKEVVFVAKSAIAGTQVTTTLFTITNPATMEGLRWSLSAAQDAGTATTTLDWAIVVVRSGTTVSTAARSDGGTYYAPEGNLLTFGVAVNTGNDIGHETWDSTTKTKRKMMTGDQLMLIATGQATNTWQLSGIIQFFLKS